MTVTSMFDSDCSTLHLITAKIRWVSNTSWRTQVEAASVFTHSCNFRANNPSDDITTQADVLETLQRNDTLWVLRSGRTVSLWCCSSPPDIWRCDDLSTVYILLTSRYWFQYLDSMIYNTDGHLSALRIHFYNRLFHLTVTTVSKDTRVWQQSQQRHSRASCFQSEG